MRPVSFGSDESGGNAEGPAVASRARFDCSACLRASKTMLNVVVSQLALSAKSIARHHSTLSRGAIDSPRPEE